MRNARRALLAAAALGSLQAGCYFLSSFDGLGDAVGSAVTTGTGGVGGGSSSSSGTTTSGGATTTGATGTTSTTSTSGAAPTCPAPDAGYVGLVMNEVAPKGIPDDWIELRNTGTTALPLCGVMITQDYDDITVPDAADRFTFGDVWIGPGKYLVVAYGAELPFGISKDTPERFTLFAPDGALLDDTSFEASPDTAFTAYESWGRIPDGTGPFQRIDNPTKGTSNFVIGDAGAPDGGGDAGDGG